MANVKQESIGTHHEKVSITLSKEDYFPVFEASLNKQSKQVQLPGFRKGKVPKSVLKKMYGEGVFQEEVLRMASMQLEKHILDEKIEFLARPLPSESQKDIKLDMNADKDYVFEYEMAVVPDFKVELLEKKDKWPLYKVKVNDEMIDEEVERFRYKAGEMSEPEEITQEDNVVNGMFSQLDENGEVVTSVEPKENSLLVKYFSPKVQKELMGKKLDDVLEFTLGDGIDDKVRPAIAKDLGLDPADDAHKEKNYRVKITKVGLVDKPEVNEEFFEKIYPGKEVKDLKGFRAQISDDIQKYWDSQANNYLQNEIYERCIHETSFELPDDFLKRWLLVSEEKYNTMDEVEAEYGKFTHQIRWELIFKKLVEGNNIDVSKEEIEAVVKQQLAGYFGGEIDDNADWVQPFIDKQMQDQKMYEQTYRQVLSDKLFSFMLDKIEKEEKEIEMEDFIKVPHSHHH